MALVAGPGRLSRQSLLEIARGTIMSSNDTTNVTFPTGGGTSVVIPVANAGVPAAQKISSQLSTQLQANTITPYFYDGTQDFNPPAGNTELIDSATGSLLDLITQVSDVLVTAAGHVTVFDDSTTAVREHRQRHHPGRRR